MPPQTIVFHFRRIRASLHTNTLNPIQIPGKEAEQLVPGEVEYDVKDKVEVQTVKFFFL